jgi:ligand-binding sensor domain-containing protein
MLGHEAGLRKTSASAALAEGPRGSVVAGHRTRRSLAGDRDQRWIRYHPPPGMAERARVALLPDTQASGIGTLGGGLLRFETGDFHPDQTTDQGLPDNSITQLLDDDADKLWVATYA